MQLHHERAEGFLFFRRCAETEVTIVDRVLTRSFLLAPDRLVEDWPVVDINGFDEEAIAAILALEPEVVLLGTGVRQIFPSHATRAALLRRGIGIEVMDNAAACRTYNLLADEGRRVVAAIMLPAATV